MIYLSDVVKFIERKNNLKLFEYQKVILKALIEGKSVYTPRCAGRTIIYKGYAQYLSEVESRKQYYNNADIYIDYKDVVESKLLNQEMIDEAKARFNQERFNVEFIGYCLLREKDLKNG